jgi:CCR4-NOT transcriptional regulation complex NOT5 subunit
MQYLVTIYKNIMANKSYIISNNPNGISLNGGVSTSKFTKVVATPYDVAMTDFIILVDTTTIGAACTIEFTTLIRDYTSNELEGKILIIKDSSGDASTYNIIFDETLDLGRSPIIDQDYGALKLIYNSNVGRFVVISSHLITV